MILGQPTRKPTGNVEKKALFVLQKGRCMYCGKKLGLAYLHVDHKIPLSRGGKNRMSNRQLLCGPCNTRKGDKTDGEYRRKYELAPARKAKGPPTKVIPQEYFQKKTKELAKKRAQRQRSSGWPF